MQVVKSEVSALLEDLVTLGEVKLRMALAIRFKFVQHLVQFEENWAGSILELIIQRISW